MPSLARLLIADDERVFLRSTCDLLRREGYTCDCVPDAAQARERLAQAPYDLLIADIKMPGNAGLEFVSELPTLAPGLPVILITGYPSLPTAIQAMDLPVIAYMVKPVDFPDLLAKVQQGVARSVTQRAVRAAQARLAGYSQELNLIEDAMASERPNSAIPMSLLVNLAMRNIAASLNDLKQLAESLAGPTDENAPGASASDAETLRAALVEAVAVLDKTKRSFQSRDLGQLRRKLEAVLEGGAPAGRASEGRASEGPASKGDAPARGDQ